MRCGEQSVTMGGMTQTLAWCAISWDMEEMVCVCAYVHTYMHACACELAKEV